MYDGVTNLLAGLRDIRPGLLHRRNAKWIGAVLAVSRGRRHGSSIEDVILSLDLRDAWYQRGEALDRILPAARRAKEQVQKVHHWDDR